MIENPKSQSLQADPFRYKNKISFLLLIAIFSKKIKTLYQPHQKKMLWELDSLWYMIERMRKILIYLEYPRYKRKKWTIFLYLQIVMNRFKIILKNLWSFQKKRKKMLCQSSRKKKKKVQGLTALNQWWNSAEVMTIWDKFIKYKKETTLSKKIIFENRRPSLAKWKFWKKNRLNHWINL